MTTHQQDTIRKLQCLAPASFQIRIDGQCMAPALEDGKRVPVRASSQYWPGDILVFVDDFGQVLAHRLLGVYLNKEGVYYLTQADNAQGADKGIARQQIIGKIMLPVPPTKRLHSIGRLLKFSGKWIIARAIR